MYCPYCDERIKRTEICPKCGEPIEVSPYSRVAVLVIALFLGVFGVHNFYAGRSYVAITQCLLSIVFCWTLYVPVAVWVWAMVEAIQMIRGKMYDGEGRVLR